MEETMKNKICKAAGALCTGLLLLAALPAGAENSTVEGGYVIHHNAITTDNLTPEIASAYHIQRSKERGMLNVSVIRGTKGKLGTPVAAKVKVTARTLIGQEENIPMREIHEGAAIYYIGDFPVVDREQLDFFITVTPKGEHAPLKAQLRQVFYTD
jgi:hypothetical protein